MPFWKQQPRWFGQQFGVLTVDEWLSKIGTIFGLADAMNIPILVLSLLLNILSSFLNILGVNILSEVGA